MADSLGFIIDGSKQHTLCIDSLDDDLTKKSYVVLEEGMNYIQLNDYGVFINGKKIEVKRLIQ